MPVPHWVHEAIFYQIFPDRFANGDPGNDPPNAQPWGTPPTRHGFQGGDLAGIRQKLDYLQDLGINAIYLNPIFLSASTHRYDTSDYYRIDPKLGSLQDFQNLLKDAHRRGMRVILDGVFNHCSRGFFAFNDLLENGPESPYLDWFHIRRFPLRAYEPGKARNYLGWWGYKSLPKLNTAAPAVRRYLLQVARYWIDQGADGWRLDVPNEIDDDDFWAEFRQTVHAANPEAYLLGEIWKVWPRWANDSHFDGLMNYPARSAILDFLNGQISTAQFASQVELLLTAYAPENVAAMYNLLGSHDTTRVRTNYGGDTRKTALAFLFQFAYPGIPAIYYGDEVGLQGGKDPDCRGAFPWDTSVWDMNLRGHVQRLIAARKFSPALRLGDYRSLLINENPNQYVFVRSYQSEKVIVAMNPSERPAALRVPVSEIGLENGRTLRSLLDAQEFSVLDGVLQIQLAPWSGLYLA